MLLHKFFVESYTYPLDINVSVMYNLVVSEFISS